MADTVNIDTNEDRQRLAALPTRPRRGRVLATVSVLFLLLLVFFLQDFLRNPAIQWSVVMQYLFSREILNGVAVTLVLTGAGMALGIVIGVVVALMRLSRNRIFQVVATAYVWFFRGIPQLVLLLIAYNFALFYKNIVIGVPFGPELFTIDTSELLAPMTAAILAFALNESAFSSEIIRAAILAVPPGQRAAATAMGMTPTATYRRVVLPQALRMSVPPLSNDVITTLKTTSLVAFIGVFDIMYTAQSIYQSTFRVVPLLIVAGLWYLFLVSVLTVLQSLLEQYLSRTGIWKRSTKAAGR